MEKKDDVVETPREWILEAETEYRFELDPGTTLAIKVRLKKAEPGINSFLTLLEL